MIIVVGDTPSSVEINAGGPIQDGGHADTSASIGSVHLWGIYVYNVCADDDMFVTFLCVSKLRLVAIHNLTTKKPTLDL